MGHSIRRNAAAWTLACIWSGLLALFPPSAALAEARAAPVTADVEFTVETKDCSERAAEYRIGGRLVAPRPLQAPFVSRLTLYLHGIETNGSIWHLGGADYDFQAEMAELGHASVVIDRLGYGKSDLPDGREVCIESQAAAAAQVAGALRTGDYMWPRREPEPRFEGVAIAGHSLGGLIAERVAFSHRYEVDALVVMAWAGGAAGPDMPATFAEGELPTCALGPKHKEDPTGSPAYAYAFPSPVEWTRLTHADPDELPEHVREAERAIRERNPCGDLTSAPGATAIEKLYARLIDVPVLLLYAEKDDVVGRAPEGQEHAPAARLHHSLFEGADLKTISGVGHTMWLEPERADVRAELSEWLRGIGF